MLELIYRIIKIIKIKEAEYVYYKRFQAILVLFSCFCLSLVCLSTFLGDYQIFEQTSLTLCAVLVLMMFNLELNHKFINNNNKINTIENNNLTDRENEIFELIIKGYSSKEIADLLSSSDGNIRFHLKNIRDKLGFKTTIELIRHYFTKG